MKKLIALLAVIGFVPTAYAATAGDITWNGEYRLLYTNTTNSNDFDDDNSDEVNNQVWNQRTRLGLTARAGEKVTFNSTFVHNTQFGANADQIPGGDDVTGTGPNATSAAEQNTIIVNEANFSWMAKEDLMIRAGRGSATIGNGLVVSSNEFQPVQKAFDGVLVAWMHEKVDVKGFGVWGATGDDYNDIGRFFGVAADLKALPAFLKTAHLHYIVVKRDEGPYTINGDTVSALNLDGKEDTTRLGLTLGGDAAGVDYSVTYAMYSGETELTGTSTDVDASMIDLEVGYAVPAAWNGRFHVGYHTDSGQDSGSDNTRYSGFHYNMHETAGLMDVVGWGNLTYTRIGANMKPTDDISVGVEYLMFTKTEKDDDVNAEDGVTAVAAVDGEDDIGTELDLSVTKTYSSNFSTTASYRMFTPGDAIAADGDDRTQIYIEGKLKF
jgi:hypothetical protein